MPGIVACWLPAAASAQSRLDGTSFQASIYNLPDSVGAVRLVDTVDSDCGSEGEVDENTDTLAGGRLDFHSHGSNLNGDPSIGNLITLADGVGVLDGLSITGYGVGMLVEPPAQGASSPTGDFDRDGQLTAADIDLLSAQVGQADVTFDLDGDGAVAQADRVVWVRDLAESFFGDADLDGSVAFGDFVVLSAGYRSPRGWRL
jgi:hypothetical protein